MDSFADIIDAWPAPAGADGKTGADILAADLGVKKAAVTLWKHRDSVPPAYWAALVRSAQGRGLASITLDLLSTLAARPAKRAGDAGLARDAAA